MNSTAYRSGLQVDLPDWADALQLVILLYLKAILGGAFPIGGQFFCISWDLPASSFGEDSN